MRTSRCRYLPVLIKFCWSGTGGPALFWRLPEYFTLKCSLCHKQVAQSQSPVKLSVGVVEVLSLISDSGLKQQCSAKALEKWGQMAHSTEIYGDIGHFSGVIFVILPFMNLKFVGTWAPIAKIIWDIPVFNVLNVPKTQPRYNPETGLWNSTWASIFHLPLAQLALCLYVYGFGID